LPSFDVHQHLWPEQFVAALAGRRDPPRLRGSVLELERQGSSELDLEAYGLEARLRALDEAGIDAAVISLAPTLELEELTEAEREPLLAAYHEGILELAEQAEGRIRPLAAHRVLDGFAGSTVGARALLDLDRLSPLLDELTRRGGLLFVHPGPCDPPSGVPAWWPAVVDYTTQMQAAYAAWVADGAERWPDLRVVFAILAGGGPFQHERLRSRGFEVRPALLPNVYLETASYGRRALELCMATFGVRQLLYGSDAPVVDPGPTLKAVHGFGQAVADALCRDNPTRLLG
jgi:predicted TIM-barrel fold metal-dependent hydrolase